MTGEEIKNTPELVDYLLDESVTADSREKLRKRLEEVCNLAIQTLEQEPVLDKIRTEVMSLTDGCTPELIRNVDVLEIIDKYRSESEDKE